MFQIAQYHLDHFGISMSICKIDKQIENNLDYIKQISIIYKTSIRYKEMDYFYIYQNIHNLSFINGQHGEHGEHSIVHNMVNNS